MLYTLPLIRSRVRSDFQQESSTGFLADSEIDAWANEGTYKYVSRLMMANQGYFETTASLDIVSGQEAVSLPYNFTGSTSLLKMVRVERVIEGARVPLTYRKRFDESNTTTASVSGIAYMPTYDFRGSNLILEPTPNFSETGGIRIVYAGLPPKLLGGTAVTGGATSITLDSTADPRDDYYNGAKIMITSGTGAGQIRTISDYVGSTQVATVSVAWGTNPTSSSVFSTLIHDDFPEIFHELIPLYASKMAFIKERSMGSARAYDLETLKEKERELNDFCADKTIARQFVQAFHPEIWPC